MNNIPQKECAKCHISQPITNFNKQTFSVDGKQKHCKTCVKNKVIERRENRKAIRNETNRLKREERQKTLEKFLKDKEDKKQQLIDEAKRLKEEALLEKERLSDTTIKKCKICHLIQPKTNFYKDKRFKGGLVLRCKTCHKKLTYRVVLISYIDGKVLYEKTFYSSTRPNCFKRYHKLREENKKVLFPKHIVNTGGLKSIKYEIAITKVTEEGDVFRTLRTEYGKVYVEKPLQDWTIIDSAPFNIEEKFWIYGMASPKKDRKTIHDIVKMLSVGAHKANMVKQVIVVQNKLVIYNEDHFHMVICKCREEAQRLHHTLAKVVKPHKITSLIFMGTATPASVSVMYKLIMKETGWDFNKTRRCTTSP